MEIRIDSLKARPRKLVFAEPASGFSTLQDLAAKGALTFNGMIEADVTATLVGDLVEVEGALNATVVLGCSRCLQPVEQPVHLQVALTFTRRPQPENLSADDVELTADDVGLIPFEGEEIDLRASLEQELLMAIPQHLLCRDDCAGLCPVCGTDLNVSKCGCSPPVFHGGFAALKRFKADKNGVE